MLKVALPDNTTRFRSVVSFRVKREIFGEDGQP